MWVGTMNSISNPKLKREEGNYGWIAQERGKHHLYKERSILHWKLPHSYSSAGSSEDGKLACKNFQKLFFHKQ